MRLPLSILDDRRQSASKSRRRQFEQLEARDMMAANVDLLPTWMQTPSAAATGQFAEIKWRVDNIGEFATDAASWSDYLFLSTDAVYDNSDRFLGGPNAASSTPLGAGEHYEQTANIYVPDVPAGDYFVLLLSDFFDAQEEIEEGNNAIAFALTLSAADLSMDAQITSPLVVGEEVTVSFTVANQGSASTGAFWYDNIYASDDPVLDERDKQLAYLLPPSESIPLAPGESYTKEASFTLTTGGRYLLFVADGFQSQPDSNRTNNTLAIEVDVVGPDLTPSNVVAPMSVELGQSFDVAYTVENIGDAPQQNGTWFDYVYLSVDDQYSYDDAYVGAFNRGGSEALNPGESYQGSVVATLSNSGEGGSGFPAPGQYYVIVLSAQFAPDANAFNNNAASALIELYAPNVDLFVEDVSAPAQVILGQTVALDWTVRNQGTQNANLYWFDAVYYSDDDQFDPNVDLFVTNTSMVGFELQPGQSYLNQLDVLLTTGTVGTHYLFFIADAYNYQPELDNDNNFLGIAVEFFAPDLTITAEAPSVGAPGSLTDVSWTVQNVSDTPAPAHWADAVYLSTDAVWDFGDQRLVQVSRNSNEPLAPGDSYSSHGQFAIPNVPAGSYFLIFRADSTGSQPELDEANNDFIVSFEVSPAVANLSIETNTIPSTIVLGDRLTFSTTVRNEGTGNAGGQWYDAVYLSTDDVIGGNDRVLNVFESPMNGLTPGSSYTNEYDAVLGNTAPGDYYIIYRTNFQNQLGETSSIDNVVAVPLTVFAADLEILDVIIPDEVTLGQSFEVTYTIRNAGSATMNVPWTDEILGSHATETAFTQKFIPTSPGDVPLEPGESITRTVTMTLGVHIPAGEWNLRLTLNWATSKAESTRANNVFTKTITALAPAMPDLVVTQIVAPSQIVKGTPFTIQWTIQNQGTATYSGPWRDAVIAGDSSSTYFLGNFGATTTLAPGESLTRIQTVTYNGDGEEIQLRITTDDFSNLQEGWYGERNNTEYAQHTTLVAQPLPKPDLVVSNVVAPSSGVFSGTNAQVSFTVTNQGGSPTSAPYWLDYVFLSQEPNVTYRPGIGALDDQEINNQAYRPIPIDNASYLNPGESYTQTVDIPMPENVQGTWYLYVVANGIGFHFPPPQVLEDQRGNNFLRSDGFQISLAPTPDLEVVDVSVLPTVFSGQPILVNYTVRNTGAAPSKASSNWNDRIYLSMDGVVDAEDYLLGEVGRFGAVASGSGYTVSQHFNLPVAVTGQFRILVWTDADNSLFEAPAEDNNVGSSDELTILLTPPPDLIIELLEVPTEATNGRTINVVYRITNVGATVTPNDAWRQSFYLSADESFDEAADLWIGELDRFGALGAGDSAIVHTSLTIPLGLEGSFHLLAIADSLDEVFESDDANNLDVSNQAIEISTALPDLEISLVNAPAAASAGQPIAVQWTVTNRGLGDSIVLPWTDRLILSTNAQFGDGDDVELASFTRFGLLLPGASYTRTELVALPFSLSGDYLLFIVADAEGETPDPDLVDNVGGPLQISIIRSTADLVMTSLTAPASIATGSSFVVEFTVANQGAAVTNAARWYDDVYLSTDDQLDEGDLYLGGVLRNAALAAGASYSASLTASLPASFEPSGAYHLIVVSDRRYPRSILDGFANQVTEDAGEANNTTSQAVEVTYAPVADLKVSSVAGPTGGFAGTSINFSYSVTNIGATTTASDFWIDAFYLSLDETFDSGDRYLGYANHQGGLAAGETYFNSANVQLPVGLTGRYHLFVFTDVSGHVFERGVETNNVGFDATVMEVFLPLPVDLVVGSVIIPSTAVPGASFTISYTVENQSGANAVGDWDDSVYLSSDDSWDAGDVLLGRYHHTGVVEPGQNYLGSLTANLPGVIPGEYHVIVRTDIRNAIRETNENNNIGGSLEQVSIDVPELTLGQSTTGYTAQGGYFYYKLNLESGKTVRISVDSSAIAASNEIYVMRGSLPTRSSFDATGNTPFVADPVVFLPSTDEGTYYVLIHISPSDLVHSFTVLAERVPFSVDSISTTQGGNAGQVTMRIDGANFNSGTQVQLVGADGSTIAPTWYWIVDPTRIHATFDLTGKAVGQYDLRAVTEVEVPDVDLEAQQITYHSVILDDDRLEDAFTIVAGGGGNPKADLIVPSTARVGSVFQIFVNVTNDGLNDAVVPVYLVSSSTGNPVSLSRNVDEEFGSQEQFLVVGSLRRDVLAPGESALVTLYVLADEAGRYSFDVTNLGDYTTETIAWDVIQNLYRDDSTDEQWAESWSNFKGIVGTTWTELHDAMRRAAADLTSGTSSQTQVFSGRELMVELVDRAQRGQFDASGFSWQNTGVEIGIDVPGPELPPDPITLPPEIVEALGSLIATGDYECDCGCGCGSGVDEASAQGSDDVSAASAGPNSPSCWFPEYNFNNIELAIYENIARVIVETQGAAYGGETAAIMYKFLDTTYETQAPIYKYGEGTELVNGAQGKNGFKDSQTTKDFLDQLRDIVRQVIQEKLESGEIACDSLPTNGNYKDFDILKLIPADKIPNSRKGLEDFRLSYSRNVDIPGRLAGGTDKSNHGNDTRSLKGNVMISRKVDSCGETTAIMVKFEDMEFEVFDAFDFCPGDSGTGLSWLATSYFKVLESRNRAFDVAFRVKWEPEIKEFTLGPPSKCNDDNDNNQPPSNLCQNPPPPDDCRPSSAGAGDASAAGSDGDSCDAPPPPPDDTGDGDARPPNDPNDIVGPAGYGDEQFVSTKSPLAYSINFENKESATAAATTITITQQLDADLDFRTFRFGEFGWSGQRFNQGQAPQAFLSQRLDLRDQSGVFVDVVGLLNVETGLVTWTLTAIDPVTGETPTDPRVGLLPPDDGTGLGQGFVHYFVSVKSQSPTGAQITAQARIIFDTEAPLDTNVWSNLIDSDKPQSAVAALPAIWQGTTALIQWSGLDDSHGSGVRSYDVYVSENGGAVSKWLTGVTATQALFTGRAGSTYAFYSIARDEVGNQEDAPSTADATVALSSTNRPPVFEAVNDFAVAEGSLFAVFVHAVDPDGDDVHYELAPGSPAGAAVDPTTGLLTWIASDDDESPASITVLAIDSGDPSLTASIVVNVAVAPAAPTAYWEGPTTIVRGQSASITLFANDPSAHDEAAGFQFEVDWNGDGVFDESFFGLSGLQVQHRFIETGAWNIQVRATDADGLTSVTAGDVFHVERFVLQLDSTTGKQNLLIGGTDGDDLIGLFGVGSFVTILQTSLVNGSASFGPTSYVASVAGVTGDVIVFGWQGDDMIACDTLIGHAVRLEGGFGDDTLVGGAGDDSLFGEEGEDALIGNGGSDLLDAGDGSDLAVGGAGADSIHGGAGEDLLIAGPTTLDRNPVGVAAIQTEWKSPRSQPERIANLTGVGVGERANGVFYLLPTSTLIRDEAVDHVFGEEDQDWFLTDDELDLTDAEAEEATTTL